MKYEEFGDHELHYIQRWVGFIIEGSETHVFEDSEENEDMGEVPIVSDTLETHIHATT